MEENNIGLEIRKMLVKKGIETPMVDPHFGKNYCWIGDLNLARDLEESFKNIMELLHLDLSNDSLANTPKRIVEMLTMEAFKGLDYANFPQITLIKNTMNYDSMLVERGITVSSYCEHHFVAIDGKATVAYIPDKKVIGLSKINRIVDFFSRRPQVQERLTEQVHATLVKILKTKDVAVVIDAVHHCVKTRGIKDSDCSTTTSKLGGCFKNEPVTRQEFMSLTRK